MWARLIDRIRGNLAHRRNREAQKGYEEYLKQPHDIEPVAPEYLLSPRGLEMNPLQVLRDEAANRQE